MSELQHMQVHGRPATVAFMTAFNGTLAEAKDARVAIVNFDDGEVGYYQVDGEPKTLGGVGSGITGHTTVHEPGTWVNGFYTPSKASQDEESKRHAAWLDQFKQHIGDFLYHGTSTEALKTIKRDGLIPSGGKGADDFVSGIGGYGSKSNWQIGDRKISVFVADNLRAAGQFAGMAKQINPGSEEVILRIDIPKGERGKLVMDSKSDPALGAWMFKGPIPPSWITGRMVNGEVTTLSAITRLYFTFLTQAEPKTLGEGEDHPFHGNQWTTLPPASDDPAPGEKYFYHATSVDNLPGIAAEGIKMPTRSQNPISLTPHLEAAHTWSGLVGGKEMALLRVPRRGVAADYPGEIIDEYDEHGNVNPDYQDVPNRTTEYDPRDEGAELATWRPVKATNLEVYHAGTWHKLTDVVK
jgi:hypothetical protein